MTESIRIPGSFEVPTRFFGQFTPKDLLRLGTPLLLTGTTVYPVTSFDTGLLTTLFFGFAVGLTWYLWRPYSKPLDTHLYNLVRYPLGKHSLSSHVVEETHTGRNTEYGDHIELKDGTVLAFVEVTPTNLEMKTGIQQEALHNTLTRLYKTVNYTVEIHSIQSQYRLDSYGEQITQNDREDEGHGRLHEDYLEYIQRLSEQELTNTRHFAVIRVEPGTQWLKQLVPDWIPWKPGYQEETLAGELDSRCREVIETLDSGDLSAYRIQGQELANIAIQFDQSPDTGATWTTRPGDTSGNYRKTVSVSELPATVDVAWILPVLRASGLVDVTQIVEPRDPSRIAKKLRRYSEKFEAEIDSFLRQGYRGTNKLETLLEDAEWFQDLLADRETQPVDYSVYITAKAENRGKCRQTFEELRNRLDTMQVGYKEPVLETDKAYTAVSPLHYDELGNNQLMPAESAAAGFPFATQAVDQETGVIYGIDSSNSTPILLDRFQWISHSMVRMGATGSGKSYATKIELLRSYLAYPQLRIWIIDPKPEYKHLIRSLNGTVTELGKDGIEVTDRFQTFALSEPTEERHTELLVDAVRELHRAAAETPEPTIVVLDEAHRLLEHEEGRSVLSVLVREARSTNTGVTVVTQNAADFTEYKQGRDLLDNVPAKIFMRHERVPKSVVDYFDLSREEERDLYDLKTGTDTGYSQALLKVSNRLDTRVQIQSTSQEHATIETGEGNT